MNKNDTGSATSSLSRLMRVGALSFLIKVSSGVIAFLMAAALSRALGVVEYGKFAALFSACLFLGQLSTFGQPKLVLRFLGQYSDVEHQGYAKGVVAHSIGLVLKVSVSIAVTLFLITLAVVTLWAPQYAYWLAIGPLVIAFAFAEYFSHVLRGFNRVLIAMAPRDIVWRGSVLLLALAILASALPVRADYFVVFIGLLLGLIVLVQFRAVRQLSKARYGAAEPMTDLPLWRRTTWGLWGLNVLSVSFPHIAVVFVSFSLGELETGALFAAIRIVGLLAMPLVAMNLIIGSDIAKEFHAGNPLKVQSIFHHSALLIAPVILGSAFFIFFLGKPLLLLFGPEAPIALGALFILIVGYAIDALMGSTGLLMQMSGNERRLLAFSVVSNVTAFIGLLILVPVYGLLGAALCIVIASSGWNIATWIWCRQRLGIDPSALVLVLGPPKKKPLSHKELPKLN